MKRLLPLILLLGGCAALQKHDDVAALPPPPAPTPCVQASQIPAEPPMVGSKFNGDAKHDLQVLAPNALALRDWGEALQTLLLGCLPEEPAETPATAADKGT